ncbi:MAG: proteasome-activating nucleotidase [Candidatus Aenigmarchaeota archaeon ex4484_52]|nr:MAG: proteasome-activating nucleotidase [Candidatus Aenigmarchaeota archaeon ex4484_52]
MSGNTQTINYQDEYGNIDKNLNKEYKINLLTEENKMLKLSLFELEKEIKKYKSVPYVIARVIEIVDKDKAVILIHSGKFFVNIASKFIGKIKTDDEVFVEQGSLTIIGKKGISKHFDVERFVIAEKQNIDWKDIGGLEDEKQELKEVIEMPLLRPDLFEKIGINPPKGVLLYGPPGCGKTLIAKAIATSTHANFIQIVASELVQKFIGDGTKFVKSIFDLAKEKKPSIIFIDELDAICSKRIELGTSGEREVQRTFMQLLAEIDGFKPLSNVKIIGATNRIDILDNAIIRPGRLERLIKIGLPNKNQRLQIFKIHTKNMKLNKSISLENLAVETKNLSGAQINAISTEAGYFALRDKRFEIKQIDFENAVKKIKKKQNKKQLNFYA